MISILNDYIISLLFRYNDHQSNILLTQLNYKNYTLTKYKNFLVKDINIDLLAELYDLNREAINICTNIFIYENISQNFAVKSLYGDKYRRGSFCNNILDHSKEFSLKSFEDYICKFIPTNLKEWKYFHSQYNMLNSIYEYFLDIKKLPLGELYNPKYDKEIIKLIIEINNDQDKYKKYFYNTSG
jgi:hypothetical protein